MELNHEEMLQAINTANEFTNSLKVEVTSVNEFSDLSEINIYGFLHKDPKFFTKSSLYKVMNILENDFGMKWGSGNSLLHDKRMLDVILDYKEGEHCILKFTINVQSYLNKNTDCLSWGSSQTFIRLMLDNKHKIKIHARELIKNPQILNDILNQIDLEIQKKINPEIKRNNYDRNTH